MNVMTLTLTVLYVFAGLVLLVCLWKDMHRSILRGCVSLGLVVAAVPLAVVLTRGVIDRITATLLHMIDLSSIDVLNEAFPSLEESAVAVVHMIAAPEVYRLLFFVVVSVLAFVSWLICRKLEHKVPKLAKRSKPIGAAIGVLFGLVWIVATLAPTAGYALLAPELVHIAGETEQIRHEGEEEISDEIVEVQHNAQTVSDTFLLRAVRALGGQKIFDELTTVIIDGEETNLHQEFHAFDALGADIAVLTATPVAQYGDREYQTIRHIASSVEPSALFRVLGAQGLRSLSRSWLSGGAFLTFEKPQTDGAVEVVLDVVLNQFRNTTPQTVAQDIRNLSPAVMAGIKAFNLYNSSQSQPNEEVPSPDDSQNQGGKQDLNETITEIIDTVVETLDTAESREVTVRVGLGLVAKELEKYIVTDNGRPSNPVGGEDTVDASDTSDVPAISEEMSTVVESVIQLPSDVEQLLPEGTEITEEEYDAFVEGVTDLAVSGILSEEADTIVEEIKAVRDEVGIDIPDDVCEKLIQGVLDSPYASLFQ